MGGNVLVVTIPTLQYSYLRTARFLEKKTKKHIDFPLTKKMGTTMKNTSAVRPQCYTTDGTQRKKRFADPWVVSNVTRAEGPSTPRMTKAIRFRSRKDASLGKRVVHLLSFQAKVEKDNGSTWSE
jgi:hypothetical protein